MYSILTITNSIHYVPINCNLSKLNKVQTNKIIKIKEQIHNIGTLYLIIYEILEKYLYNMTNNKICIFIMYKLL